MKDHTRIVIVLDRSGSMEAVKQATIDGFNEFVNCQQKTKGSASLKLVQFDDYYETHFDTDIQQVPKLNYDNFIPRGMTALLDALGTTIDDLGKELARVPERNRPNKVLVVVITDGHENASRKYRTPQIAEMIRHQREKYSWEFVFLGANQDAILTAKQFNIPARSSMTYNANDLAVDSAFAALSTNTVQYRSGGRNINFTEKEREAALKQ